LVLLRRGSGKSSFVAKFKIILNGTEGPVKKLVVNY